MVDASKIADFLDEIYVDLRVIRDVVSVSRNGFLGDLKGRFALRYAIVDVVGNATLIGLQILEEDFNIKPETYEEVFDMLADLNVISSNVCNGMNKLVELRNIIVHLCLDIDDSKVYKVVKEDGLEAIKRFVEEVRNYIGEK